MTSIRKLNDDVLFIVFSFLERKDALAASYCAKRFYHLAITAAFRSFKISKDQWKDENGWGLRENTRKIVTFSELLQRKDRLYKGLHRGRHLRRLALRSMDGPDFLHFPILLTAADRLQKLLLDSFEYVLSENNPVAEVIGNMGELKQLIIRDVGPWTIERLPAILSAKKLISLSLTLDKSFYQDVVDAKFDLASLAASVSAAPALRSLHISAIDIPAFYEARPSYRMSSLKRLSLICLRDVSAAFIDLCDTLEMCAIEPEQYSDAVLDIPAAGQPPLQVAELHLLRCIGISTETARRVGEVGLISLGGIITPLSGIDDVRPLVPLLQSARPIAVEVFSAGELTDGEQMWHGLFQGAPRLRYLEITVTDGDCNIADYKAMLLAALRCTAISYLNLYCLPGCGPLPVDMLWGDVASEEEESHREAERVFAEGLASIPYELAAGLPALRVIAMSHSRAIEARVAENEMWNGGWGDGERVNLSWPDSRLSRESAKGTRVDRWWRVEVDGSNRRPVEISREEAEVMREEIQRADFDIATTLKAAKLAAGRLLQALR
ncbi:uncharacterized protein BXZ73DRAFT_110588 [Epithele typhae]|uniref:uncharacterized protein n=1 Tax=Epithele typhae TaxID=378194 RepID=UPI00200842B5|nr:uncharacterized protein BXZ73DRAFT_110588 [Epithele typhae]KAH9906121.1 hypothetical protein BXZ73DRAFT_110588 [Epithele typhae]